MLKLRKAVIVSVLMNTRKFIISGFLAGLAMLAVSQAVSAIAGMVPGLAYSIFELGGMRAMDDPIAILFFAHFWVLAFAMAYVYGRLGAALKGDAMAKGKTFGIIMWLVASLPSIFLVWSSMDYPLGFHIGSIIGSVIYMPAAGIIIAKFMG